MFVTIFRDLRSICNPRFLNFLVLDFILGILILFYLLCCSSQFIAIIRLLSHSMRQYLSPLLHLPLLAINFVNAQFT